MNKKTKQKIQIAKSVTDLYLKNTRFKMSALADVSDVDPAEIYDYFPNRKSVLEFYYESVMIEYQEITRQIEGYPEFTLAEKLSNLAYTILDLFEEHKEFVSKTYKPMIVSSSQKTAFSKAFETQLKVIYENDSRQSALSSALNNQLLYKAGLTNFHLLVGYWLKDSSRGNQKTMELIDKWTALVEEIHYNSILDRGFDFAKFLFYNSPFNPASTTSKKEKNE